MNPERSSLFLEVCHNNEAVILPLHSSIALFLLSYTECKWFQVYLVSDQPGSIEALAGCLPNSLAVSEVTRAEAPALVAACRLPAVLEPNRRFCRAGLAVVLRHIIQTTCCLEPERKDVSRWTKLCELDISSAVEDHLRNPTEKRLHPPAALLQLEHRLAEPVKVHNDDKLRRHKLQQQKNSDRNSQTPETQLKDPSLKNEYGLEMSAALAKLSLDEVSPVAATRERSDVRKVKTTELPELEHVFAEGLYFTLTDVVLLPCVHQYLISLQNHAPHILLQLPLLLRWYQRVQEVPGVRRATEDCGIVLFCPQVPQLSSTRADAPQYPQSKQESPAPPQEHFVGGPRPTLTKLQEHGIEAIFSPHPCPTWTLDWEILPAAVNPTEEVMKCQRAEKKIREPDDEFLRRATSGTDAQDLMIVPPGKHDSIRDNIL
ncbi:Glutathione S-transferase C-terminal domain-containing protein [Bagarius yarrelli]|uniref:Glutathione S-transferase C-terminal domain-containing protein n=1 Tax=Bagarius yarrelli TaxID=175774 RepID=A0A556TMC0_BAGYA|nr:Glutathione S-transferase C-terminal domain-containing protein [Bagarius yarrelli]